MLPAYRERHPHGGNPSIVINSIDMRMLDGIEAGDLAGVTDYLATELERLARAGADLALLASNTSHLVFGALRARSPLPLVSIVEATGAAARERHLTSLGLLGTRFTMQGRFYPDVFAPAGIDLVVPGPDEQSFVHERYMGELVKGRIVRETRARLLTIIESLKQGHGIQGLVLGGTELSMMFPEEAVCGIPVLDTTKIHVGAAVAALLS